MRTETIIKTYLTFDELNEDQQEKVIEKNRNINIHDGWDDCVTNDLWDALKMFGFRDVDISHRVGGSQRDGANFTATISSCELIPISKHCYIYKNTNLQTLIATHNALIKMGKAFEAKIDRVNMRSNLCVDAVVGYVKPLGRMTEKELVMVNRKLRFIKRELCEYCYERIRDSYHHKLSDEAIEETLGDLEFDSETLETIY